MSADSPRRGARGVPAIVPPQVVSDRSIIDSVAGFINDVTLAHQPQCDPKDTITWARFETAADISDSRFGDDWELEGNVAPPLLLILGYGQGVQVWAIPANGEAVEVLSWRHGIVSALRVLPTPSYAENGRADEPIDAYADKRPLMAICDGTTPAGSNPQFCAVNFHSLKTNTQVKTIKFKNPVLDILANRSSIVITFHERIAVFDARSLEDRLSVTTCFPSPGINPNPVALGSRWMAYSENKLLHSKRSGGGCDGDGVSSYTATVLNAAKSFGKGLRELGEQVAAGLTGTTGSGMSSKSSSFDSASGDVRQPGVVTILDIKHPIKDVSPTSGTPVSINGSDPIVAHFIAHSEAVVAMEFDNSGMMLLTADRRGHDFHLFRIQPHPVGSSLAAVHHLYVLHRGDTSAKVQNITFSLDSRWVAVSTLRGTTHVFPVTPYGGPAGVRTHTSLHVVNKLSRFHRSAGLTADGRSSSPISHSDSTNFCQTLMPYHNPTLPPFPRPTVVLPLAQLRQPFTLGSPPGSAAPSSYSKASNTRQRLSSLSDDNGKPLSVCAVFAKSRSWLLDPPIAAREAPHKIQRKAVDSLFVMAGHGALIQYDLDTKLATNVAKEKICDDTPIELEVEARAQWNLGRKEGSLEIVPPLSSDNWLIKDRNSCMLIDSSRQFDENDDRGDSWLSQVEIITHAGPHRRLWMGPQFVFKTYNTPSGSNLSHIDVEAVEIGVSSGPSATCRPERSSPLNMPLSATGRSTVPVLIESGSYSSIEQSPKLMDRFRHEHMNSDFSVAHGDTRLKEDLADAMRESPSVSHKDTGGRLQRRRPSAAGGSSRTTASSSPSSSQKARCGGSGGVSSTSSSSSSSAATLVGGAGVANSSPSTTASPYSSQYESLESSLVLQEQYQQQHMKTISIEKVVNPLGTVTTITGSYDSDLDLDDVLNRVSAQDYVIHENCDESLFRPVVAIFCDESSQMEVDRLQEDNEYTKPPEAIGNKLIVPVIEKSVDLELTKKESLKNRGRRQQQQQQQAHFVREEKEESDNEVIKHHLADVSKRSKSDRRKPVGDKPSIRSEDQKGELTSNQSLNKESKSIVEEEISKTEDTNPKLNLSKELSKEKHLDKKLKPTTSKACRSIESDVLSDSEILSKKFSDKAENNKKKIDLKPKLSKTRESVEKDSLSDASLTKSDEIREQSNQEAPIKKTIKNRKSEEKDNVSIDLLPKKKEPFEEETVTITLRIPKNQKSKSRPEEESPKPQMKQLKTDYFEEEKPIEFKRMTMTSSNSTASSSKTSNKGAKIDKTVTKMVETKVEGKFQIKSERKTKLQKGSSGESNESTEVTTRPAKPMSKVIKEKSKSPEKDEIDGKSVSSEAIVINKATDVESKRKKNEVVRTPKSSSSLAIELSNVSDLADSLLDFLPDKSEEEKIPTVCVDKLKKTTDNETVDAVPKTAYLSIQPEEGKPDKCELVETHKETKKTVTKAKTERKIIKASSPTMEPDQKVEHFELVSDVSKKDTIIVVEEKSSEDSESSACIKNFPKSVEICPNPSEAKFKSKRSQKSKASIEKSKRQEETEKYKETSLPDPKEPHLFDISSSESQSPAPSLVENNISTTNIAGPQETTEEYGFKSDTKFKNDEHTEMTASQVTVEPSKEDTFLSDLMDSQKATKSKVSSIKETKPEELPKKNLGSPLQFVDTYVDSFVKPTTPAKKENSKKKHSPDVGETSSEVSLTDRLKSPAGIQFFDKFLQDSAKDSVESITPWKPLIDSAAQANPIDNDYPTLGKPIKTKKSQSPPAIKKAKGITFTIDLSEQQRTKNKKEVSKISDTLPSPQPLEDLPPLEYLTPLPPLEPWEGATDENVSLINFESPLQEASKPIKSDPEVETKSSPQFPKGFPADNIIFALCGSLHYENENSGKLVDSPLTLSYSDSTAHTTAEYKSLTENDDQYLSLEQSSQENAPSTSSSTCEDVTEAAYSSGGGEKVPIVLAKTKYKQRKKLLTAAPDDDEELRPLINKNDDVNNVSCNTPSCKGKSSDKVTAIMKKESLPPLDNNQVNSDSSSSDQATTTSEDPDDQICLNVHASGVGSLAPGKSSDNTDKSADDEYNLNASIQEPQQASHSQQQQQQQQNNPSKKKLKRRKR